MERVHFLPEAALGEVFLARRRLLLGDIQPIIAKCGSSNIDRVSRRDGRPRCSLPRNAHVHPPE